MPALCQGAESTRCHSAMSRSRPSRPTRAEKSAGRGRARRRHIDPTTHTDVPGGAIAPISGVFVANRILERYPDGVDGLFDGAVQDAAALPAVKTGGGVATVRWYQGDGSRDLKVHAVSVAVMAEEQAKLDELRQLAEDGVVTRRVADSYAPDDAGRAHERLESGGTRGRLVIDFTR